MDKAHNKPEGKKNIAYVKFFVSFTTDFKYLGLWISYDLHDNFDINKRLMQANQAMSSLKPNT